MNSFELHARLAADTLPVDSLTLCQVRLMNDRRYPWLILIPQISGLTELHQVPADRQPVLWREIIQASEVLQALSHPFKLNVAALGNQVPQLHIHIIARQQDDAAWPAPVWGIGEALPYEARDAQQQINRIRQQLANN